MNTTIIALSYAFCWGVGVTLTKIALSEISATTLLIIQLSSSVLFLGTVCYWRDRRFPFSQNSLRQGVAGIFEPGLAYMIGIFGVKLTTASNAVLISSSEVILTILFAALFLKEKLTWTKMGLAGVSFLGLVLLTLQDAAGASRSSLMGDLLVLLGTFFAVLYVLLSKKQIKAVHPLTLTASQQLVGFCFTAVCFSILSAVNPDYQISFSNISPQFWLLAVLSGVMQYALAFLLYLTALRRMPASQAAFYIALIPIFGIASAILILQEQPSIAQGLGALFVIGSSYVANRLQGR